MGATVVEWIPLCLPTLPPVVLSSNPMNIIYVIHGFN